MGAYVRDDVGDNVLASVVASVRNSVRNMGGEGGDSVWAQDEVLYGAHDATMLAFYHYFREVVGLVDQTARLSGRWELAQSAGWALPYRHICWVVERHNILARDDHNRLHCETGPACAYPDGWEIYAVHGVRVPAYVIERPHEISVERIDGEGNAEVRRIMIERYRHGEEIHGTAAFIRDAERRAP
jgi:hypothetical protein